MTSYLLSPVKPFGIISHCESCDSTTLAACWRLSHNFSEQEFTSRMLKAQSWVNIEIKSECSVDIQGGNNIRPHIAEWKLQGWSGKSALLCVALSPWNQCILIPTCGEKPRATCVVPMGGADLRARCR